MTFLLKLRGYSCRPNRKCTPQHHRPHLPAGDLIPLTFSVEVIQIAEKLIDMEIIGALGTDMHHTRHANALDQVTREHYLQKVLDMPLINREL